MTMLEKIEREYGTVIAYDGRLAFWTKGDVVDVRDAAARLRVTRDDIADAMPEFKPTKRGKATLQESVDTESEDVV